jgi:hypothetical protein
MRRYSCLYLSVAFFVLITPKFADGGPGVANSITVTNVSGAAVSNYPSQFGRPFLDGAIANQPQVLINGQPVATQADVKNRYPDGSVEFAVIAVVIPAIPASGSLTLTFQNQNAGSNTPLTQAQMLAPTYNFDASLTLTPVGGTAQTASARTMLQNGDYELWTSGPVAQTVMLGDDSAARKYDIGFGDGFHPFRPRFYATFWPVTQQVYVRVVGENGLTTEQEDLAYKLAITSNGATLYTKDLTGAVPIGSPTKYAEIHWVDTRWSREFWLGGAPSAQVNIDNNLPYLVSTRFLPSVDTSITIPAAAIASDYAGYIASTHDIYDGGWDGGNPFKWVSAMGTAGDSGHIGVFPLVEAMWLHTPDWRFRYMALNQVDLAAAWPLDYRESDPTRRFQRSDAVGSGTGLGRSFSVAGRPLVFNGADDPRVVGKIAPSNSIPWTADAAHQPSVYFAPYILTGDPWYLDMLYAWAGITAVIDTPAAPVYVCTRQTTNCSDYRGPTGAYGGLYGENGARDVAWTLRGRVETAFAAPDGTPEKAYFTYMTNDALAKWEGGLGITGTAFDTSTIKQWVLKTDGPYPWTLNTGVPPLGNMASICSATATPPLCGYPAAEITSWGMLAGANGSFDDPWMNFYLEYAVGRAVELGFAAKPIQASLGRLPIGIVSSSVPYLLGEYTIGVQKAGGGYWPDWPTYIANGLATTGGYSAAALQTGWAAGMRGGRQTWVQPGLAELVDQGVPGADATWAWYNANGYSLPNAAAYRTGDPRWAVVPRTDNNALPPQPTTTPP